MRRKAARRFKPSSIKLLLVAEAPPSALDRYFYFPTVGTQDSLFRYVARLVLGREPTRANKPELLGALSDAAVFLIDLCEEPIRDRADLRACVPGLIARVAKLKPRHVILVKATVFDLAYFALRDAGQPVVERMVPFPGSGQQRRFEGEMGAALASIGWVPPSAAQ
jgi:hypothetical protein